MSSLADGISSGLLQALGWALIHFTWQGAALMVLTSAAMRLCRRPAIRYIAGVCGLAAMLAAPVATFFLVYFDGALSGAGAGIAGLAHTFLLASSITVGGAVVSADLNLLSWLSCAWACGVMLFGLRFAGGFVLLERRHRRRSARPDQRVLALCHAMQQRLGMTRIIRYRHCDWLQAPAVIGWIRPVLLLPVTALTGFSEDQLRAIIAHELAHIRRHDALVNLFQILVESLLFYHPAVWWLNRRIRAEREICCDEVAVSLCGDPVAYVRALALMEEWKAAPALAMAANSGSLSYRMFCVLGQTPAAARPQALGLAGGLLLLGATLAAGDALMGMSHLISARPSDFTTRFASPRPMPSLQPMPVLRAAPNRPGADVRPVRHRQMEARQEVRVVNDDRPAANAVETASSPDLPHRQVHFSEVSLPTLRIIDGSIPQILASLQPADPFVCRPAQQLPRSRFYGPRTCLPKSEWALLREKGEDIGPDGREIVAANVFGMGN